MQIRFLGSGGAFSDFRVNYQNNALIETAAGPVLIDCGTTACQSLREMGVAPHAIQAVLFTHLHADHASPEQLIWERAYMPDATGRPGFLPTRLVGTPDLIRPLRASLQPFVGIWSDEQGRVRADGVDALAHGQEGTEHEIGGVRFRYFRVPHVSGPGVDKPAYGLEIDDGKHRVFWSGDTTLSPKWVAAAVDGGCDLIFHECMFCEPFRGTVHSHYPELARLPGALRSRICLMHHTVVPTGVDPVADGFVGAAARHQVFTL